MSRLSDVPGLIGLVNKHGLKAFVETGCGDGEGLRYADEVLHLPVRFSCDLNPESVQKGERYGFVKQSDSLTFLKDVVENWAMPSLFWLDAHFPNKFGAVGGEKWPLPRELDLLTHKKGIERDVIIADDIHCINDPDNPTREDGPGHDWEPVHGCVADLIALFKDTHTATIHKVGTGILILEPK